MKRIEARVPVVEEGVLGWTTRWERYSDGSEIATQRTHFRLNGSTIPAEVGEVIITRHGYL